MSKSSVEVGVAVGANLGDRLGSIRNAVNTLDSLRNVRVVDYSSVYESEAHTIGEHAPQPPYLNALVLVTTSLSPHALLEACLRIESENGRERTQDNPWEARTLDLDIIVFGNETVDSDALNIPHPRLAQRQFVLQPLFEIRPDFHIPAPFDSTVRYLLTHCTDTGLLTLRVSRSSLFSPDEFARIPPSFERKS